MAGIECPICMSDYTDPRSLPCGHTFCQNCIEEMTTNWRRIQCPIDRNSFAVPPDGFNRNYALQDVLQQASPVPSAPPYNPSPRTLGQERNDEIFYITTDDDPPSSDRNETENTQPQTNVEQKTCQWLRTKVRNTLKMMFGNTGHKTRIALAIGALLLLTFSRIVAGAVKLSSDCDKEYDVALYLFIKSCFAFLSWSVMLILVIRKRMYKAMKKPFYELYLVVDTVFTFIWLILGSLCVFARYKQMEEECPVEESEWNASFIQFAFFLTVVDWLLVICFIFYFCLVDTCYGNDDDEDTST